MLGQMHLERKRLSTVRRNLGWIVVVALLACDGEGIVGHLALNQYAVTVLADYDDVDEVALVGINNAGNVLWNERSGANDSFRGVLWRAGDTIALPLRGVAISEDGGVVGTEVLGEDLAIWRSGQTVAEIRGDFSVLGWAGDAVALKEGSLSDVDSLVFFWDGASLATLQLPERTHLQVWTVREDGAILGSFQDATELCFIFKDGMMVREFTITQGCTPVVSQGDWVVAIALGQGLTNNFFLFRLTDDESFILSSDAVILDINTHGSAVGHIASGGIRRALLVSESEEMLLNDFVGTSGDIVDAVSVNDHGQILALARERDTGRVEVIVLTPLRD